MRITVDIAEKKMREILKVTRQKKKSPAVAQALDEYLKNRRRQAFLNKVLSGQTDYAATNDEVESFARIEP
ncbi:MAG: type II toxin-antitoxin system VapB family antitoxin [Verrucomicrobia bacterium]|nr:type II toxin-antitoxin system VapB family antitoxin [Verrucomicrobiota bacterium]